MKKLIALLMLVASVFLIACNGTGIDENAETEEENSEISKDAAADETENAEESTVKEEEKTEEKVEPPKTEPPKEDPKVEPPKEEPKTEAPAPEAVTFTVAGNEFSFGPTNLTAKVGQPVKIVFKNNGKAVHDLQVVGLGKTALIDPGQTGAVEFTPTSAGSYEMICTVPGHKELGMAGTLTVE